MKQESTKKTKKWLLPVIIAAAVLVVAGIVLALVLGSQSGGSGNVQSKLYWNVDREANLDDESGMSIREPGSDGLYTIRFAVDGEQVEYKVADKRLVNQIDFLDVMGLAFDADGLIIEAFDPKTVATEVAKDFFVQERKGDVLVVNSSQAMNGMRLEVNITEKTGIYNVSATAAVVGEVTDEFEVMDKVLVYANAEGENTHIFITQRFVEAGVYYRLNRMYNANTASTSREPDENGVYTIPFAYEGEQVELKCKDRDLVSSIDAGNKISSPQMGLLFDEEGYIIKKIPATEALRGKLLYSYFHVDAINGTTVDVISRWGGLSSKGDTGSFELPEDFDDIFLMEADCHAEFAGQRVDTLQVGDHVYVYTDFDNNPLLIYINRRLTGYPLYYNISRSYNSTTKETKRKVDENGYYVFEMMSEGKEVTLKTKDKALASKVDMYDRSVMGLKVEGNIIVDACPPECVTGRVTAGNNRYVTENLGTIVRMVSPSDFTSGANYVLAPGYKVYDVSGAYGVPYGTETTLRPGDRAQCTRNPEGELTNIFITYRYEEKSKLYFFPSRYYNSTTKETKREPDAEGYYVFENMMCEGKNETLKTKDKALASYIDKQSSKFVALEVSNGIIKKAYTAVTAIKYGYMTMKGVYYDKIDEDGKFSYYSLSTGEKVYKTGHKIASKCDVFNCSTVYDNFRGEKTKLQKDDYYYAFGSRENFLITKVFVRSRQVDSPLYWPVDPQFNDTTGETNRVPDGDGYYWIEVVADGKILKLKTKDKALASKVDDYNYAFALKLKGDEILNVYGATSARGIDGYDYRDTYVKSIEGNKAHLVDMSPSSVNYGKDLILEFTSNSKIYDVCPGSETFGQATELKVGDRIASYQDADGKVVYCFIKSRGAVFNECEACYKQAIAAGKTEAEAKALSLKAWVVFSGGEAAKNTHYYLTQDFLNYDQDSRFMVYSLTGKICLDLNGHKITMAKAYATADGEEMTSAAFRAYSNGVINLMDSKGTAVVEGYGYGTGGTNSGCAVEVRGTGILNIYGGTYKRAADAKAKVAIGCHGSGYGGTINIYGGTVESIYVREGGTLTLAGTPKIAELTLDDGAVANIDGLKPQAQIAVKGGNGKVLTAPSANAAAVKDCFVSITGATVVTNSKNELVLNINVPDFTANAFTTDFDPANNNGYAYCEACYKQALAAGKTETEAQAASMQYWTAYDGTGYEKDQHYYLTGDYTIDTAGTRFVSIVGGTTCLNLNGHSVTMSGEANRAMIRAYASTSVLNLMDAKGTGVLTGKGEHYSGSGTVIESRVGSPTINIYGGTLQSTSAMPAIGVHHSDTTPILNIYGGNIASIKTREGTTLTLSGAPQISDLTLADGVVANIDALATTAQIAVEGEAGKVISNVSANAAAVKDCFIVGAGQTVEVNADGALEIAGDNTTAFDPETAFTTGFDPANNDGYAYCEACYKQAIAAGMTQQEAQEASLKEWTVYDKNALGIDDNANLGSSHAGKHYYLDQDVEFDGNRYIGAYGVTICWNLNGHSVNKTSQNGIARVYGSTGKPGILNIMDAKGNGALIGKGNDDANKGCVIEIRLGTCNLYGVNVRVQENATPEAITVGSGYVLNIYDGNIEGGIKINGTASLTLNGAPVVTGLTLSDSAVANIDNLLPQAQIAVEGAAGKVISNVSDNAANVKDCFTAGEGLDVAVNADGALELVEDTNTFDPETAFTTEFDPANNDGYAYCEACYKQALAAGKTEQEAQEASLKEWTVFTGGEAANNTHYYLTQSFTGDNAYNASRQFITLADDTVCWNLNGQSITMAETTASGSTTRSVARVTGASTLNIMDAKGTGVLTGFKNITVGKYGGSVVEVWDSSNLNIYGGTFRRTAEQGTLSAVGFKADWTGTANIYGGDIEGIYKRTVGTVNLVGAPVITLLQMADGATYNIDGLLPEAQITVVGALGTIFTVPSDNAAAVKDCFTAGEGLDVAVNADGALEIVEYTNTFDPETAFTTEFKPAENNGSAYCEACYKQALAAGKTEQEAQEASLKEWTAIHLTDLAYDADTGVATGFELADGVHYYLAEDIIALTTAGNNPTALLKIATDGRTACLHLNGKTVRNVAKDDLNVDTEKVNTATNDHVGTIDTGVAINVSKESTLNIMGEGYVSARNNVAKMGAVNVYGSGTMNIYGGTYSNNRGGRLAVMARRTAQLNVYGGTFLDPIGLEYGSTNAHIVIENGLFQGYAALSANAGSASACTGSSITVNGGTFETDVIGYTNLVDAAKGNLKPVIQGGTFTVDPSEYVDTTVYAVELNENIYVVQAVAPVQVITEEQEISSQATKN